MSLRKRKAPTWAAFHDGFSQRCDKNRSACSTSSSAWPHSQLTPPLSMWTGPLPRGQTKVVSPPDLLLESTLRSRSDANVLRSTLIKRPPGPTLVRKGRCACPRPTRLPRANHSGGRVSRVAPCGGAVRRAGKPRAWAAGRASAVSSRVDGRRKRGADRAHRTSWRSKSKHPQGRRDRPYRCCCWEESPRSRWDRGCLSHRRSHRPSDRRLHRSRWSPWRDHP